MNQTATGDPFRCPECGTDALTAHLPGCSLHPEGGRRLGQVLHNTDPLADTKTLLVTRNATVRDEGTVWMMSALIWGGPHHGHTVSVVMDHRMARGVVDALKGLPNQTDGLVITAEQHQIGGWPGS